MQEEVEEMEEVLDGLRRWLARIQSIDWVENYGASLKNKVYILFLHLIVTVNNGNKAFLSLIRRIEVLKYNK